MIDTVRIEIARAIMWVAFFVTPDQSAFRLGTRRGSYSYIDRTKKSKLPAQRKLNWQQSSHAGSGSDHYLARPRTGYPTGKRVLLIETTGSGAGKHDSHALEFSRDGDGLLIEHHWHALGPSSLSEDLDLKEMSLGLTVSPAGLVLMRDRIDQHLATFETREQDS